MKKRAYFDAKNMKHYNNHKIFVKAGKMIFKFTLGYTIVSGNVRKTIGLESRAAVLE